MKTDRQIKAEATKAMNESVFENFNAATDITAECSNGYYERRLWTNPSGSFGWDKWVKVA